jgi:ABC-type lipoprotein release transport system permease subunit
MTWFFTVVIVLFVLTYATLAVLAWRHPLLSRLAVREAVRRPGQAAVVVAGLMVGTAAILAVEVGTDSTVASSASGVEQAWGRVDLTVSDGGRPFSPEVARALADDPRLDPLISGVQSGIELVGGAADLDRETARASTRLIGFDPATQSAFAMFRLADGRASDGRDLAPDEVVISRSLADGLDARVGDRLRLSAGSAASAVVEVAGIALPVGPGAYGLRPAVYAPLSALARLMPSGSINLIRMSGRGDGDAEIAASHDAIPLVRAVLDPLPGARSLVIREDKREGIEEAVRVAEDGRTWLTAYGLLIAVTGVTVVANLVVAIAEERRSGLAVLRAMGLSRSGLVLLSLLEGGLYSLVAAAFGLLPGSAIAGLLIAQIPDFLYTPIGRATPVHASVQPISIVASIAAGSLIVMAAMLVASVRTSRLVISAAIKDLPSPPTPDSRSRRQAAVLIALVGISLMMVVIPGSPLQVLGGIGLIAAVTALARGRVSDRSRATLAGAALAGWVFAVIVTRPRGAQDSAWALLPLVFGLSIVMAANLPAIERLVDAVAWRRGVLLASLRPPLAYASRRPVRAGLGIGAFALVVTAITTFATVRGTYDANLQPDTGQYSIRVTTASDRTLELPASVAASVNDETSVLTHTYRGDVGYLFSGGGHGLDRDQLIPFFALTGAQLAEPPVRLWRWESRFRDEHEVWRALRDDPSLLVSSTYAFGTELTLQGADGPVTRHVAAIFSPILLVGLAGSPDAVSPFGSSGSGTTTLIGLKPGYDVTETARTIQRAVSATGAEVTPLADLLVEGRRGTSFVTFVYILFGVGLFIGVAGLGVLAVRAVVERRRGIGVLRAMGFSPRAVVLGLLTEAILTATCGLVVGLGGGLVAGYFVARDTEGVVFGTALAVDAPALIGTVALVYAAVLLFTIGPAVHASRIRPAEALRLVD